MWVCTHIYLCAWTLFSVYILNTYKLPSYPTYQYSNISRVKKNPESLLEKSNMKYKPTCLHPGGNIENMNFQVHTFVWVLFCKILLGIKYEINKLFQNVVKIFPEMHAILFLRHCYVRLKRPSVELIGYWDEFSEGQIDQNLFFKVDIISRLNT